MSKLFTSFIDDSIKDGKVSTKYSQRVVQGIDIPNTTDRNDYLIASITNAKIWTLLTLIFGILTILIGRLFFLQVVHGSDYREIAEGNRIRVELTPAARGIMYDHTGKPLVKNIPNFTVTITPSNLPKDSTGYQSVLGQTANTLEISLSELETNVEEHSEKLYTQPLVLKEYVPYEQALTLSTKLNSLPGVSVDVRASREYIQPEAYSHILGYLGRITADDLEDESTLNEYLLTDSLGKSGLEWQYEANLRGHKGRRQVEVNAQGNDIEVIAKEDAIPGNNLVLSIDAELQEVLYTELSNFAEKNNIPGGAAVAIDPRTGRIKALVSFPGYDSNLFTHGIDQIAYQNLLNDERKPLFNKAVSGEYPSGSTFKLVVGAAALQENVITPETTVNSTGGIQINAWRFPDYLKTGHGITDIRKALAVSVNTFFYLAGGGTYNEETLEIEGGLGIDRINKYAALFGLGSVTGIDLPGEATGFLPTPEWKETTKLEPWYIGDTYHVSIGQGDLLVTPLQVALYTSAIANNGTVYSPKLVESVTDQTGAEQYTIEPTILNQSFVDSYYLQVIREGMRQAVTDGSARRLQSLPVTAAGKTGTAQIGGSELTHSWFTSFAPYDNPELVLTVLVEKGGEGGAAALPIAEKALQAYFTQ